MKKQTFFNPLYALTYMGMVLLLGLTSCQKEEASNGLWLPERPNMGHSIFDANTAGTITDRAVGTCECEFKIYSVSGAAPGYHPEFSISTNEFCTFPCYLAAANYSPCWDIFDDPCSEDLGEGSTNFTLPTRWIPFNCLVDYNQTVHKSIIAYQVQDGCAATTGIPLTGNIVYGVRCKNNPVGSCSSPDWNYSTSTIAYLSSGAGGFSINFGEPCDCNPVISQ